LAMLAASAFGTNVGDLWAEILFPGRFTSLGSLLVICVAAVWYHRRAFSRTEAGYWIAMFIAGVFGTVAGDLIRHSIGLYSVHGALCMSLAALILIHEAWAPASMVLFWLIVMLERCAGTAVGDALASRRAVGLGVMIASICTGTLTIISLWIRARTPRR
jgi:uncharacterized membrane-anchored protein